MTAKLHAAPALLAIALALTLPRAATAVDGVIEINQARALSGYVTASDTPGFPVTIDSSGSYRLTGNLSVSGGHHGIHITQGDVMLDLNGFSIVEITPDLCTCAGVQSLNAGIARVSNGSIRGFRFGVNGNRLWVASMQLVGSFWNTGINGGPYSVIVDSTVESYQTGIEVGGNSVVRGCTAHGNVSVEISSGGSSLVSGNDVAGGIYGIRAGAGSTVVGNNAQGNLLGIEAASGSTVLDNTLRDNTNVGIIFTGTASGYARNVLTGNNLGDANPQVSGPGVEIGTNLCSTDTICP